MMVVTGTDDCKDTNPALPAGLYHIPFVGYPTLWIQAPEPKLGEPRQGTCYKPTGRLREVGTRTLDELCLTSFTAFRTHVPTSGLLLHEFGGDLLR